MLNSRISHDQNWNTCNGCGAISHRVEFGKNTLSPQHRSQQNCEFWCERDVSYTSMKLTSSPTTSRNQNWNTCNGCGAISHWVEFRLSTMSSLYRSYQNPEFWYNRDIPYTGVELTSSPRTSSNQNWDLSSRCGGICHQVNSSQLLPMSPLYRDQRNPGFWCNRDISYTSLKLASSPITSSTQNRNTSSCFGEISHQVKF